MKKSVFVSLCAGLAMAGSAMAQLSEPVSQPLPYGGVLRPISMSNMDRSITIMLDGSGVSNRTVTDVYLNNEGPFFSTGAATRSHTLDDGNFTAGDPLGHSPAAGGNIDVTMIQFSFVCTAFPAGGTGFSMVTSFYNTIDATHATNVAQGFLGGIIWNFGQPPQAGVFYTTGLIDITPVIAGGIHFPDDDFAYENYFMTAGGTPAGYPANKEIGCTSTFAGGSPNSEGFQGALIGFSDDIYARDTQPNGAFTGGVANGGVDPNEFRFFGGAPNYASFWLELQANVVVGCPADFNGDTAVDFFDYDDFVICFEGGVCPPGKTADFNNDTAVDFFDYDDFVVAFETPC